MSAQDWARTTFGENAGREGKEGKVRLVGRALTVRHGPKTALDRVDVALRAGEVVGLLGPNGSGKSTLLRVLLGVQPTGGGYVELDGVALLRMSARTRARSLTMVTHGAPPEFTLTVQDLVGLGRVPYEGPFGGASADDERAVAFALAATETTHFRVRAIDTLSSGELARVHLARAFAQGAQVILLDEPTANLDPHYQLETMRLLRTFAASGGAVLLAIHDMSLAARHCDRVVVLSSGRVRADGPPGLALSEALMADVFRVRASIVRDAKGRIEHMTPQEPLAGFGPGSRAGTEEAQAAAGGRQTGGDGNGDET